MVPRVVVVVRDVVRGLARVKGRRRRRRAGKSMENIVMLGARRRRLYLWNSSVWFGKCERKYHWEIS